MRIARHFQNSNRTPRLADGVFLDNDTQRLCSVDNALKIAQECEAELGRPPGTTRTAGIEVGVRSRTPGTPELKHFPSVAGCAFGFAAAGFGVGSLVGMCLAGPLWRALPVAERASRAEAGFLYGSIWVTALLGIPIGALVGVAYARRVRRRRGAPVVPAEFE